MGNHIPINNWSKDHWSLLAYIETVMVDAQGFQVGFDGKMRQNPTHFEDFNFYCPVPRRPSLNSRGIPMDPKYSTRLITGTAPEGHDDWDCVVDMLVERLFRSDSVELEPKEFLYFSDKGWLLAHALRRHKAQGGSFANFYSEFLETCK